MTTKARELILKPSDLRTDTEYWDTFGKCEREVVARNVVVISRKKGRWF